MRIIIISILILFICLFIAFILLYKKVPPPQTAKNVDLNKYVGVWYEIARFPHRFEKGCICVKAEYKLKDDYILVKNSCLKGKDRKLTIAKGKAWSLDNINNSKLKVRFFWPFKGDYWIIYVDSNYKHAIVGTPSRKHLWILSRTPKISPKKFNELKSIAKNEKFEIEKLIETEQDNYDF